MLDLRRMMDNAGIYFEVTKLLMREGKKGFLATEGGKLGPAKLSGRTEGRAA